MKWTSVLISSTLLLVLLLGGKLIVSDTPGLTPDNFTKMTSSIYVQLGFYDLLSEQKGVYDGSLHNKHGTIVVTLTSPDDSNFLVKGQLVNIEMKDRDNTFEYQPIDYNSTQKHQMVNEMLDPLHSNRAKLTTENVYGQYLIIMQNDMIFLHNPMTINQ